jgi:ribosomal protein S18 acetylase RimI-like enzyme
VTRVYVGDPDSARLSATVGDFAGGRVAAATCRLDRDHYSIFRAVCGPFGAPQCGNSTSARHHINPVLNIALEERPRACFYLAMSTTLIEVRRAKPSDATAIAATHDEAWRGAYQGVIPGPELEKLINRRGPQWWDSAIRKGSRIAVLAFGDCVAGYANYGRNRARSLYYDGEVYELYLRPEFQGLGFGRKLFSAARRDLVQSGLNSLVVWALSDNEQAVGFYRALGGKAVARSSERFGTRTLDKVAFAWTH